MIDTHADHQLTTPGEALPNDIEGQEVARIAPLRFWSQRLWHSMKSYPLPLGALTLLLVSLLLWLVGRPELAHWVLLVVVLLGGLPLFWETVQQFRHREFSVDLIALLAITGSLLLGEYLAGALVVLMLSGGKALEAYALRRARSSLSALAQRAPHTAHIWQDEELINVPTEVVDVGMIVVVKPGELIPVDGVVVRGPSLFLPSFPSHSLLEKRGRHDHHRWSLQRKTGERSDLGQVSLWGQRLPDKGRVYSERGTYERSSRACVR